MFKKLLLATLIVMIGLWGAGYDVTSIKDSIRNISDKQAGDLSGRAERDESGWGPDT